MKTEGIGGKRGGRGGDERNIQKRKKDQRGGKEMRENIKREEIRGKE